MSDLGWLDLAGAHSIAAARPDGKPRRVADPPVPAR